MVKKQLKSKKMFNKRCPVFLIDVMIIVVLTVILGAIEKIYFKFYSIFNQMQD